MREPRLLMVTRDKGAGEVEAEGATWSVDDGRLVLVLDDGEVLTVDALEVNSVLKDAA